MWAFYGNLWGKGDHLMETSYLKAHPFGNCYPEWMPNLPSDRIRAHALGDLSAHRGHLIPLYHGGGLLYT